MKADTSFQSDFKKFFGRGLAILLPSIVTLWILWQAFLFLLNNVAEPINRGIRFGTVWAMPLVVDENKPPAWYVISDEQVRTKLRQAGKWPDDPEERALVLKIRRDEISEEYRREYLQGFWADRWYLQFVGLVIAVLLIYLAGLLLGNFVGKQVYGRLERLISRVPGFKQVYPHVKQLVELILGDRAMAFGTVVLVEYPSKDIWTLGFLTGESFRGADELAGGEVVSVFIPTSPTPFTGFTINVDRRRVRAMDMPMDQALRFVITAGVLVPDKEVTLRALKAEDIAASTQGLVEKAKDAPQTEGE
ncbi:MAG: DUF502 domain-containing protein [Phycisphaeraceae bacterium]|nr:DUF502 domain-containing protein [Phycisphaeraceae bacterium]MCW5764158.1 DUF502 domain-containing protein [Phycisphaeraceae bacterium]